MKMSEINKEIKILKERIFKLEKRRIENIRDKLIARDTKNL